METEELWIAMPRFGLQYEISNIGSLRSLDRTVETVRGIWTYRGKALKTYVGKNGYHSVRIGNAGLFLVHRLVAEHFVQNPDSLSFVDHIDDNKLNNVWTNLRWVTHSENSKKFWRGIRRYEGATSHTKLDEKSVSEIRELKRTMTAAEIGVTYGVSKSTILRAANRKTWAHVE